MFDIAPLQIMIVLALALLVFGPKRLPEMGRNLGRGLRDFKGGLTDAVDRPDDDPDPAQPAGDRNPDVATATRAPHEAAGR